MSSRDRGPTSRRGSGGDDLVVAIASGKGGTGKTTVAVNLARSLGDECQLLDCDVEGPNCHLFLAGSTRVSETVNLPVPRIDADRCNGCGACSRFCQFNAIVSFGTVPLVFPELCHGCGGCALVCPHNAIAETERRIGIVEEIDAGEVTLIRGVLDVGVPTAPPLIREVKRRRRPGTVAILDAPPGTSCPVVTTVRDVDFVVLVTEPTPFGLHDLGLAVAMVEELGLPCGVVVNRADLDLEGGREFCERAGLPILLEIPDDRRIAEAYSRGELLLDALPEYRRDFMILSEMINRAAAFRPEGVRR